MESLEKNHPIVAPTMPAAIAEAVVQIKKKIRPLGKDSENKFAKYNYVSVDKFYEVIGQLMAENGLFTIIDEISVTAERRETQTEQGAVKASVWLTSTYEIFLYHQSGVGYGPIRRTIMVQATGAQAFGSGMSYIEKYFLRSLFKVPTGDEDADADERAEIPARGRISTPPPHHSAASKPNGSASSHADHPRRAEALDAYKRLGPALSRAITTKDAADLFRIHQDSIALIGVVSPDTHKALAARFAKLGIDIAAETRRSAAREPGEDSVSSYLTADDAAGALR